LSLNSKAKYFALRTLRRDWVVFVCRFSEVDNGNCPPMCGKAVFQADQSR